MLKACMTFMLVAFILIASTITNVEAKTKNKKKRADSKTSTLLIDKKKSIKKKKNKKNRVSKYRRYNRSGTGPSLRALTTENPYSEYTQNPDNGVNALETKSELQ